MPPESPVPGWSVGEVCTLRTATRGFAWLMSRWYVRPAISPVPQGEDRLDPPNRIAAPEDLGARVRREGLEVRPLEAPDLSERVDQRRTGRPVPAVRDLHRDPET